MSDLCAEAKPCLHAEIDSRSVSTFRGATHHLQKPSARWSQVRTPRAGGQTWCQCAGSFQRGTRPLQRPPSVLSYPIATHGVGGRKSGLGLGAGVRGPKCQVTRTGGAAAPPLPAASRSVCALDSWSWGDHIPGAARRVSRAQHPRARATCRVSQLQESGCAGTLPFVAQDPRP